MEKEERLFTFFKIMKGIEEESYNVKEYEQTKEQEKIFRKGLVRFEEELKAAKDEEEFEDVGKRLKEFILKTRNEK